MDSLAKNLKRLREERGLSQERLAALSKVSQQMISALERGVSDSIGRVPLLAKALDVAPAELDERFAPEHEIPAREQVNMIRDLARFLDDDDLDDLVALARRRAERASKRVSGDDQP